MALKSKIEWTDSSWNPVDGCCHVSRGCEHCYAESIARRFWKSRKFNDVRCWANRLDEPLNWKKPRKIFLCSMGDIFHHSVDVEFRDLVFEMMAIQAKHHIYFVLTKRTGHMMEYLKHHQEYAMADNIWYGVSIEDQYHADRRLPIFLDGEVRHRFVSVEPMLEKVDLVKQYRQDQPFAITMIDWVICGCESGFHARPFDVAWARFLKNQCYSFDKMFFYKQGRSFGKLIKMPMLDGQQWNQGPDFPKNS